jgi:tRNA pseudouridine38-40 synthase
LQDIDKVNVKLIIEYDGKNYSGWQKQKSKPTIQETIENSIKCLFPGEVIKLIGAGRTDTGVHAFAQTANFKIPKKKLERYGLKRLVESVNSILPEDIAVISARKVNINFHSRYSAKKRIYCYYITGKKHALSGDKEYYLSAGFNIDKAKEFCKIITGYHSFKNYCKSKTDNHGFYAVVDYAKIKKLSRTGFVFEICANRFLHSMVRAIVGVMVMTATGKISIENFKKIFFKGEPIKIQYVPAKALFLKKVIY